MNCFSVSRSFEHGFFAVFSTALFSVLLGQEAEQISVYPGEINLELNGQQQLLVQQKMSTGLARDLTREALFSSSNPSVASVTSGVIRAQSEGLAKVRVEADGQALIVDVIVKPKPSGEQLSFMGDVLPVLGRAGCTTAGCHAKPMGQNGFTLSIFSFDPAADYREIVKDERGRRVFPAFPAESLILQKPTLSVEHE